MLVFLIDGLLLMMKILIQFFRCFLWLSIALKCLPFFQLNYDVILSVYDVINREEGEEGRKDYWMREQFDISNWKVWLYSVQVQAGSDRHHFIWKSFLYKLNTLSTQITNKFWLVVWINMSKNRASKFSHFRTLILKNLEWI